MNCQEFSKVVDELVGGQLSLAGAHGNIAGHAASCVRCHARLEAERALTIGLKALASDEKHIEAPAYLRNDLLVEFKNHAQETSSVVVSFPQHSNWARWAWAAAATILIGLVMFAARWSQLPKTNQTAENVPPAITLHPSEVTPHVVASSPSPGKVETQEVLDKAKKTEGSRRQLNTSSAQSRLKARNQRGLNTVSTENVGTEIASTEIKSAFVPLTYLNDATAMDSGIVIRVEVAREKLASLGLPFDLARADEIIKADIVLGDDGVARAIRLVQ